MEISLGVVVLIYLIGVSLLIVELFVPGGVTGVIGVLLMAVAIFFVFSRYGPLPGLLLTLASVIGLPVVIVQAVERNALRKNITAEEGYIASEEGIEKLAGMEGEALTKLRPAGMAMLGDRRVDVVAESEMIEKGAGVRVVKVEGNRVVVRQTSAPPKSPRDFS